MKLSRIIAIARKDLKEATGNKAVVAPMFIIPLLFVLLMPAGFSIMVSQIPEMAVSIFEDPDMAGFVERMPQGIADLFTGLEGAQTTIVFLLGFMFAPFFLIIPMMFATVIASESFAGERERKTIESLLYTPASDTELFVGKVLAGLVPSVLITWGSFVAYTVVANVFAWPVMGRIWFPLPSWYPLIFWVTPAISLLGVAFTVLISTRVQTFMAAYQTSASLVLLVLALLAGQVTGVLYLSAGVGMLLGLVMWLVDGVLTWLAVRAFSREKLLVSQ